MVLFDDLFETLDILLTFCLLAYQKYSALSNIMLHVLCNNEVLCVYICKRVTIFIENFGQMRVSKRHCRGK